jgi:phospholipid/cholesterol/gamma-HCH transport system substrate-binding protein
MTRQAQVGAFALVALLLLFGAFYEITNFGTRYAGYRIGVHFESASGLTSGAQVYFSGVAIGTVDSITLLPDNTVDVILAINRDVNIPKASKFLIQAPLTGSPNLLIVPPRPRPGVPATPQPILAKHVLPIDQQPRGTNPASVSDLLAQGQGEAARLDKILALLEDREPKLLSSLQTTLKNANALMVAGSTAISSVSGTMQGDLARAGTNLVELTATLNDTTKMNSGRVSDMLAQFDATSHAMDASMTALEQLATDPSLKSNLIDTTKNIAQTTQTIAELTADLRSVTHDPQTQAQIKNTVANLDATMQRANSLLGQLGGRSSVYGVDAGATPYPVPSSSASPYSPNGTLAPTPPPGSSTRAAAAPQLRSRLSNVAANLFALQLRLSELGPQKVCCPSSLFSADRGPQTDVNAIIIPHGSTSLMVGANDIGYHGTANFAVLHSLAPDLRIGGGVLYSQLGVLGQFNTRLFGVEARAYDLRRPELDLYGNVNIVRGIQLFAGERAFNHEERRPVYGIQAQFP